MGELFPISPTGQDWSSRLSGTGSSFLRACVYRDLDLTFAGEGRFAPISDLAPLSQFPFLTKLTCDDNEVESLEDVGKWLPSLCSLTARNNRISKLFHLPGQTPPLKELDVSVNNLTTLESLAPEGSQQGLSFPLWGLKVLLLDDNHLSSLRISVCLPLLKVLSASNNRITDLEHLGENFPGLTSLNVSGNLIKALGPIRVLGNLEVLDISQNQIPASEVVSSLSAESHPRLFYLEISGNPVGTTILSTLASIPSLRSLGAKDTSSGALNPDGSQVGGLADTEDEIRLTLALIPHLAQLNGVGVPPSTKVRSALAVEALRLAENEYQKHATTDSDGPPQAYDSLFF